MTRNESDETVPVSELMNGDDYEATLAEIRRSAARGENPFASVPDTRRPSRRPVPSLVIGLAMLNAWCVSELAREWEAFGSVAGLVMMVSLLLFVKWAKAE